LRKDQGHGDIQTWQSCWQWEVGFGNAYCPTQERKEQLSQSLKRRKDITIQMNGHLYIEEIIKDFYPSSSSDEENEESKNSWKRLVHCKKKWEN